MVLWKFGDLLDQPSFREQSLCAWHRNCY